MSFLKNIQNIRDRARQQIENGAITKSYTLNREQAIGILNEALATELVCVLRYKFHYFMASGIHSAAVANEFLQHANEEQEHADRIARRIKQLGGKPQMHPAVIAKASHSEYREGTSLADMIREDLVAERIAIETYREIVDYFGEQESDLAYSHGRNSRDRGGACRRTGRPALCCRAQDRKTLSLAVFRR